MTASTRSSNLGRHVFGVTALAFGLITLVWHNYKDWDQLRYILNATDGPVFVYLAAAAWIFGGVAIQFRRTAKTGAIVLGAVYLVFALLCVPRIVEAPQIYDSWGNFFEQFSLVTAAAMIYGRLSSAWRCITQSPGRILVGICAGSFALEQAIYLDDTAKLVPKWLPPGQMFWAITTTVPFVLAAVALLTNRAGTSCDSPADDDAPDLWAARVASLALFGSPQSFELERKRRDLRDCRNRMDSRRSPRRVQALTVPVIRGVGRSGSEGSSCGCALSVSGSPASFLIPNHYTITVRVQEFRAVAPGHIPWLMHELNATGREFSVLRVNALALKGQHAVAFAIRHWMLNENQFHATAVFESAEARFDVLELHAKTKVPDVPVARCKVIRDVNRQMVKQNHAGPLSFRREAHQFGAR